MSVDDVTLWQGDCLDKMSNIADGSVDMVLCDLPYGSTACAWDSVIPLEPLWAQYRRIIKPRGALVFTAAQPFTSVLVSSNYQWFKHEWVWRKTRTTGFLHAKHHPLRVHESVLVFANGVVNYHPQMVPCAPYRTGGTNKQKQGGVYNKSNFIDVHIRDERFPLSVVEFQSDGKTIHPTQKPVALMEYLIRTYTNYGNTVLDNTMGSGSTGVATVRCGRNFIGIERDDNYFGIAERRIAEAVSRKAEEASRPVVEQARLF